MRFTLYDDLTEEHSFGWVFRYGPVERPAVPSPATLPAGIAPFIVDRRDGSLHVCPSGAVRRSIEAYERTGALPRRPH
jgi:hypothetical protein